MFTDAMNYIFHRFGTTSVVGFGQEQISKVYCRYYDKHINRIISIGGENVSQFWEVITRPDYWLNWVTSGVTTDLKTCHFRNN